MREFFLKASTAFTSDFSLNDIAGAGRMDVVCRCVTAALWLSDDLRKDTKFYAILEGMPLPPKIIKFDPLRMRRVYPDERNIASHIKIALTGKKQSGIEVETKSFEDFLNENSNKQLIYLHRDGKDIRKFEFENDIFFVLGDNKGLNAEAERTLDKMKAEKISIGKHTYMASHVISIVHNELDRRE